MPKDPIPGLPKRVADLTTPADRARLDEQKHRRFEDAVVTLVLNRLGQKYRLRDLRELGRGDGDFYLAQLETAFEQIPQFPGGLAAAFLGKLRDEWPVHRLFTKFADSPMSKEFLVRREEAGCSPSEVFALAFNWPYLAGSKTPHGSVMCLHTIADAPSLLPEHPVFAYAHTDGSVMIMQPFGDYLKQTL